MNRLAKVAASCLNLVRSNGGSRFRQNFLKVAKANLLAQIIAVALAPLLTRLYSPADYGTAALFASLLSFLAAFATCRFEWSIPNATSHALAAALLWLGLLALLATSIGSSLVLAHVTEGAGFGATFHDLARYLFLLPIALVGTGVQQLMQGWFARENDLTAVSKAQVRQSIVGSVLRVGGGLMSLGALGLIGSSAVSAWAGFRTQLGHAAGLPRHLVKLSLAELGRALREFAGESFISSVVSIINIASTAAIPFLFARYYSPAAVGWYALMNRLALTPVQLFANALGRSFWSEAACLVKTDRAALRRLYLTTAKRLAVSAVPVALLCMSGPLFVEPVFGRPWRNAGYVLLALTPGVVSQFIVQPITHLIVHRKQHWKLYLDACKLAAILAGVTWLGARQVEIPYLVLWVSLIHVIGYIVLFFLNLRCLSNPPQTSR